MKTTKQSTKNYAISKVFILMLTSGSCFVQAQTTNLGTITKNKDTPKYVAIGSSLSAGVSDGGLFAESQQNAFPVLLAKQMGIANFKVPILDGKGTVRSYLSTDKNGIISNTEIEGDFDDRKKEISLPKITGSTNNLAIPYQKMIYSATNRYVQGAFPEGFDTKNYNHSDRYFGSQELGGSYLKLLSKNIDKADFFTYELGIDDFTSYYNSGGFRQDISAMVYSRESFYPEESILDLLKNKNARGVIFNVPNVLSLPYYNQISYDQFRKLGKKVFIERFGGNDVREATNNDYFLPTPKVLQSLNGTSNEGLSIEQPFKDQDIIGIEEVVSPKMYNDYLNRLSQIYNVPLFNLAELYEKILNNSYKTSEGVLIDSRSFFSKDGITPSYLGQRVITNELIKLLNDYYNTNIPFILK
jgi:hypothetical protein